MTNKKSDDHARDWMDAHPKTSLYIAGMVTIVFVLQLLEFLRIIHP